MGLEDRFLWLALGCLIGLVIGYMARDIRDKVTIRRIEAEEMEMRRASRKTRGEKGFLDSTLLSTVMLLLVVVVTAGAAIQSQIASNRVTNIQNRTTLMTECNKVFLDETIVALNERTTYTRAQADANAELQQSQADFLSILLVRPAASPDNFEKALQTYFDKLTTFVDLAAKTVEKQVENPFPTQKGLNACLSGEVPPN